MRKKKIVIIQRELPFYTKPLFDQLLKSRKFEFYLISGSNESVSGGEIDLANKRSLKMKNININIKNFEFWWHLFLIKKLRKIKPDAVIIEGMISNLTNWRLIQLKKKMGFKLIGWVCGYQNYTGKTKDFLLRVYFHYFDYCLAYHTAAKRFLMKYGFPEDKITILHNSREVSFNYNKKKMEEIKNKYSLKNKKVILFIGRIKKSKKIDLLLEAIKRLDESYACLVVGDGDYLPYLKNKYKKNKNIKFVGEVIEGNENYFKLSDIFVLPGPGGLSLNEAVYHGLPIISSYGDGSAEDLVINDYNGFLIRDVTSEKLTEKIRYIFENNKKKLYAKNSLKLGKKFSFENFVRNFIKGAGNCLKNGK